MQALNGKLYLTSSEGEDNGDTFLKSCHDCTLTAKDGGFVIRYAVTENGSKVIMTLSDGRASILRLGENKLKMEIIPGRVTQSRLSCEQGVLCFDTKGIAVEYSLDENGGNVRLKYFNGSTVTVEMKIVTEQAFCRFS